MSTARVFLVSSLAIIASCKTLKSDQSQSMALADRDLVLWPDRTIPMCWGPSTPDLLDLKKYLAENITREFARARIKITGWTNCAGNTSDGGPYPLNLTLDGDNYTWGTGYRARMTGVNINISKEASHEKSNCRDEKSQYLRKECILGTAIHEFGHFVALDHEHERLDTWNRCPVDSYSRAGTPTRTNLGSFDADSIMNYCVDRTAGFNPRSARSSLSQGDIDAIEAIYNKTATFLADDTKSADTFTSLDKIQVSVVSPYTKHYRYILLYSPVLKDQECSTMKFPEEKHPASKPITLELKKYEKGVVKVCVLGTNIDGIEQNPKIYSSLSYIIDRTPAAVLKESTEEFDTRTPELTVEGEGVVTYIYKFVDFTQILGGDPDASNDKNFAQLNPCFVDVDYSKPIPVSQKVPLTLSKESNGGYLCLRGIDAKGTKQSILKTTRRAIVFTPKE